MSQVHLLKGNPKHCFEWLAAFCSASCQDDVEVQALGRPAKDSVPLCAFYPGMLLFLGSCGLIQCDNCLQKMEQWKKAMLKNNFLQMGLDWKWLKKNRRLPKKNWETSSEHLENYYASSKLQASSNIKKWSVVQDFCTVLYIILPSFVQLNACFCEKRSIIINICRFCLVESMKNTIKFKQL